MNSNDRKPKAVNRFTKKLAESRFFTTSLAIHLGLIAILSTVVIVKTAQKNPAFEAAVGQQNSFMEEEAAGVDAPQEEEFEEEPISKPQETTAVAQSALSSLTDSTATWSTSASMNEMTVGTSLSSKNLGTMGAGTGSGRSGIGGGGGGKMPGTIFGVKVEAAKLGVVLDVSGSAQKVLIYALNEIGQNFKEAQIILYPGCGMLAASRSRDFNVKSARSLRRDFEENANVKMTTFGQIGNWIRNHPNEENKVKDLLKSPNTYLTVTDPSAQMISGCQYAFKHLIKDGADTIYWFADFNDAIDKEVADDLIKEMKAKGITLIAHNFAGKPVRPEAMAMVEATGGKAISQIPGKSK